MQALKVDPENEGLKDRIEDVEETMAADASDAWGKHGDQLFGKPTTGLSVLYALKDVCQVCTRLNLEGRSV